MFSITLLTFSLIGSVFAANDWSKPCLSGSCSYDHPLSKSNTHVAGSLRIWGAPHAISDITPAAGWHIMGCNSSLLAQDIRLVCTDTTGTAGCNHLFGAKGPVGKIVRLPEDCGKSPFARISKSSLSADQTIPPAVVALVRRNQLESRSNSSSASNGTSSSDKLPQVYSLSLDTNFGAVNQTETGPVSLEIQGATLPGAQGDSTLTPALATSRRHSRGGHGAVGRHHRHDERGLLSFIETAFKKFNSLSTSITQTLPPLSITKSFPLMSLSVDCPATDSTPAFGASVKVDLDADVEAVVAIGLAATGTLIPPEIKEFGLFATLTGDVTGTLDVAGSATGSVDTGVQTLFSVGVQGLEFPGILSIGPTFKLNARAKATLDADVDLKVQLAYHVDNAKMYFPSSSSQTSGGTFGPKDSSLKLSVTPSVKSTGTVEGHLIPTIDLGVSAFGGLASADVFLALDASTTLALSLAATTTASVSTNSTLAATTKGARDIDGYISSSDPSPSKGIDATPSPIDTNAGHVAAHDETMKVDARDTTAGVQGCAEMDAEFNVNAGASGSFFGVFNAQTTVSLFDKKFQLFKQCFGTATSSKRMLGHHRVGTVANLPGAPHFATRGRKSKKDGGGLICPGSLVSALSPLFDGIVGSSSITPI